MSRLDQHITLVQNKLALGKFLHGLGWSSLVYGGVVCLGVLIGRLFSLILPHQWQWFFGGVGVTILVAAVYAYLKRPNAYDAAVAIDLRLALKEKFSTALYVRSDSDVFAQAAVRDAERTAENVSLHKRFPLDFPMSFLGTAGMIVLALLATLIHPLDLLGKEAQKTAQNEAFRQADQSKKIIKDAIVEVQQQSKIFGKGEAIQNAQRELEALFKQPPKDPDRAQVSARKALQDVADAVKQQIAEDKKFAEAQNDSKIFRSMSAPTDEKGPVADAHRALAKGDFEEAVKDIQQAVDDFKKMDPKAQQAAAQQMQQLAKQLAQAANNPQVQKQLQKMGANPQQAQQMQQMMQQAAQGNPQAAQQLQQMAQQVAKQMNNGKGASPQQQQQIQQLMQQMQAQANAQGQAGQMAQAAQQMAQAMQQAAKAGNSQGQQGAQQMGQAQQAMQQQMQQMQALQNDAQQMAAAQQQMNQAANGQGKNPGGNNGQNQQPGGQGQGQGQGQWQAGNNNQQGNGNGGPGQGNGPRGKQQAPYTFKAEKAPVQDIDNGKLLASFAVKAGTIKGEAKDQLKQIGAAGQREATDEVDSEMISKQAKETVKRYFNSMEEDK